jgi:L-aminopeptidase/D-esterase-like protein
MFPSLAARGRSVLAAAAALVVGLLLLPHPAGAEARPRARALGIPFEGRTGPLNAITDVQGVEVGYATIVAGQGKPGVVKGIARTGVTAVWPRGKKDITPVFAGWFALNGNGEMTGTTWLQESGYLEGPVTTTNTYSIGTVRDSVLAWLDQHAKDLGLDQYEDDFAELPVVAETSDAELNDMKGFHVKRRHVFAALDGARGGPVAEGNVGAGTGMTCFDFKGGMGTASRRLGRDAGGYTVGVLSQCNFGLRHQLVVAGVPVGRELGKGGARSKERGSILVLIATDSPLLPHQLRRLAKRASHGLARTGSVSGDGSGDLFLAFSTANRAAIREANVRAPKSKEPPRVQMLSNNDLDDLFEATAQATEESIINALIAAETMIGVDGHVYERIPFGRLKGLLKKYHRLASESEGHPRPGPARPR